ncbi:hypothetical protein H6P81_000987 [Aristolochia fimbriata]|uniref:Uncharacterized protein n=1 Tax=Aristolochia fimbriata TaxID=158543 RepID=A0AAV7F6C8_ARIFI|nr:hypothetical protein H6P81_000987 [Aristolochia fimbriata]
MAFPRRGPRTKAPFQILETDGCLISRPATGSPPLRVGSICLRGTAPAVWNPVSSSRCHDTSLTRSPAEARSKPPRSSARLCLAPTLHVGPWTHGVWGPSASLCGRRRALELLCLGIFTPARFRLLVRRPTFLSLLSPDIRDPALA